MGFVMPDLQTIAAGGFLLQKTLELCRYIREQLQQDVVSAYFDWDGALISGDDVIRVEKHPQEGADDVWWFTVTEYKNYAFIRAPITETGVMEMLGQRKGEANPDAQYWRWVANRTQGVIYGGQDVQANAKVRFIVIGYEPEALIKAMGG